MSSFFQKLLRPRSRNGVPALKVNLSGKPVRQRRRAGSVMGRVVSVQPNGFTIVKLNDGGEAVFDRFDVLGSKVRVKGRIREGMRVRATRDETPGEIVHLKDVSPA